MSAASVRKKKSFSQSSKPSVRMCVREQRDVIMTSPEMCWPVPMRAIGAQNLLTMPGGVSTAGYLHKKGGSQFSLMKWPLRYIIIHKGCVYYFKSSTSPAPQGAFSLNGYNRVMRAAEETTSSNVFPFKIVHFSKNHRTWFFSAASEDERRKWMRHLRKEIDHYNDRRESHIPSDSDSDADSFYGTIERLMDIKHTVGNPEDDYMEEDDDEEEEDYIRPDTDCSPTTPGRPAGPPPSYPPPPVPAALHHWLDSSPGFHKGPPPPIPLPSKMPPSSLAKKPPPPFPPPTIQKELCNKGPPPPLPFASHLQKSSCLTPPIPPPPNQKKQLQGRMSSMPEGGSDKGDRRPPPSVTIISSALCSQFESKMSLNGSAHHSSAVTSGSHSPIASRQRIQSNHVIKQGPPLPPPNTVGSIQKNTGRRYGAPEPHLPPPSLPPMSPHSPALPKPSVPSRPLGPKPPPPIIKPPLPTAKPRGPPIQRTSPEGQSFRSSLDEIPADRRKSRKDPSNHSGRQDHSDEEYENVQLPDSVFIDTTESSWVEKLFKESAISPQDGLYGIRNSSTKTSKVLVVWDVSLGKARNYRLFEEDQRVFLDNDVTFPSLSALVEHYHSHPLPHHGSLCLQKPYGYALPR
ncbi:SH3 domain-binding protein 2 [Lampris incognitus]|uniref:SH3 domain-binding protein 2 n=1 Tax=Lampris incognitus TaxID=2546036 RepID=UPI0024B633AF|nr:SH3 domain-binding protein 2 [Lampris incognitus]